MSDIGHRIKKRREEIELSQAELARRSKVSQGTIAQLETGRNQSSAKIVELSYALGVSPEWLLYGKNTPTIPERSTNIIETQSFLTSEKSNSGIKPKLLEKKQWDADYIEFIQANDESMSPVIGIYDDVAVNKLDTTPHENGVFAIRRKTGIIIIRRLVVDFNYSWIYRCDNPDKTRFSDIPRSEADTVIGRVIWRGGSEMFNC
ncbi:XRE family transcriptional regulator [Stenoxybacter acetivorans]|uniref:XRE family transcriptional regulator n=1 Tax=Stenoxybacter acetivorans TaxID=422441 RepID=UPI00055C1849|nr:helix-turn-helix domain-containing protein [Stenoxybacter acetivorans]